MWNRNFFLLWQGGMVSAIGNQAYLIAVMLWTKEATESGTLVGIVLFAGGIASLWIPFGGVLADRFSRVRLLVWCDLLSGISVLILAGFFWFCDEGHPAMIVALVVINFVRGSCAALFQPVASALVPDLVDDASLNRANSTMQITWQLTSLVGQSAGGILFRILGAPVLLLIDGISFLLSAVSEIFIRSKGSVPNSETVRGIRPWQDFREAIRFSGRLPGFRIYLLEASCVNLLLSALFVSFPFYVTDTLGAKVDWYGYLLGTMGLGAVIGGLIGGRFSRPGLLRGWIQIICLIVLSCCQLPLSLVGSPWQAMVVLFISWICVGFHQVILTTLVQKRTPREMRGRVLSMLTLIRIGLMPIGMAVFGILIDVVEGQVASLLFWTGIGGLAVVLLAAMQPTFRSFFTGDESLVGVSSSRE